MFLSVRTAQSSQAMFVCLTFFAAAASSGLRDKEVIVRARGVVERSDVVH
jgi:hypothetical protein